MRINHVFAFHARNLMASKRKKFGLDDAYSVESPDDNIKLYRDWADTYESEFVATRGYVYPRKIAELYARHALPTDSPVLDVGAGTGLVAEALVRQTSEPIDGIDISEEMLNVSRSKGIYRNVIKADLTAALDLDDDIYGAVVSAGTFTHGHVGPEALGELLRITKEGALFMLGINAQAFDRYGFGSTIAALNADGKIRDLKFFRVNYYEKADDEHGSDQGLTACFRAV